MAGANDWNAKVIDEFRANGGRVGGQFDGVPLLLLTTTGARSGRSRVSPVTYLAEGDRLYVFASKAGAPTNPDWYHNLVANPEATVEVGTGSFPVRATVLAGDQRDDVFRRQVELQPGFADYQANTDRVIPVVALDRV